MKIPKNKPKREQWQSGERHEWQINPVERVHSPKKGKKTYDRKDKKWKKGSDNEES
jgi:hypothetical protein